MKVVGFSGSARKGEVVEDDEGMLTMNKLGENMAWLLKKIHA